jgi:hypothetical protein
MQEPNLESNPSQTTTKNEENSGPSASTEPGTNSSLFSVALQFHSQWQKMKKYLFERTGTIQEERKEKYGATLEAYAERMRTEFTVSPEGKPLGKANLICGRHQC